MSSYRHITYAKWWPAVLVATVIHASAISFLLLPARSAPPDLSDSMPLAVTIAPLAISASPPVDLAVDKAQRPAEPDTPVPRQQLPDVVKTARGELAPVTPIDHRPAPSTTASSATVAAAPPALLTPPSKAQSAAPVEAGSTQPTASAPSWQSQVLARLEKAKRYPDAARLAREQDTVVVSFSVDANGRTSHVHIRHSAGYQALEDEAAALVERVSPLPPPPDRQAQQLVTPIEFQLDP